MPRLQHERTIAPGVSRAILIEPTDQSVEDAERFGPVVCMFDEDGTRPSIWRTDALRKAICERLAELKYNPENDYIILTGQVILLTYFVSVVANEFGTYRALAYSAPDRGYVERNFG